MLSNLARRHESVLLLAIFIVVILTTIFDSLHSYWYNPGDSIVDIMRQTADTFRFALSSASRFWYSADQISFVARCVRYR